MDKKNNDKTTPNDGFPNGWDEHRRQQIIFIAKNTTPLQRLEWVEEMLELFKDQMPRRDISSQ